MKKLAVIILNWNGLELLKQFLPAAEAHTIDADTDLIVADNGSSDDSVAWIKENHPAVKVVEFEENFGFAEGYNRAIAATDYPYTLLLNSDVEVTPGWTRPLLKFMEDNPRAGAAQPKIMSWRERGKFEYAGAAGGYLDRLGYPYCRGRLFDVVETDEGQYDTPPHPVAWASGAALIVRTSLYNEVGGLDSAFFAHMEEIDLCLRMQSAGYGVFALSDSRVYHVGGASLNQGNPKKIYLNFRNNLLLLYKNSPLKEGRLRLIKRRLADSLAWAKSLISGDFAGAGAILRAHRDFRKMKKRYRSHPAVDFLPTLPGYRRHAVLDRFIKRQRR